jgi:hypothetical protein
MNSNHATAAFFNPRVILALALCSCGVLLGMFSLAAAPSAQTANSVGEAASLANPFGVRFPNPEADSLQNLAGANSLAAVATSPKETLPPGVPMPPGAQFSVNSQADASSSSPTAGLLGFRGMPPLRPGTASRTNS